MIFSMHNRHPNARLPRSLFNGLPCGVGVPWVDHILSEVFDWTPIPYIVVIPQSAIPGQAMLTLLCFHKWQYVVAPN